LTKKLFCIKVHLESIHFYVKIAKIGGKKFQGHYWLEESYLLRVEKNSRTQPFHTSKDTEFLRRFQKYKLTLVTKWTYQKIFQVKKKTLKFVFISVKTRKNL
jgi:hypothetical protein